MTGWNRNTFRFRQEWFRKIINCFVKFNSIEIKTWTNNDDIVVNSRKTKSLFANCETKREL